MSILDDLKVCIAQIEAAKPVVWYATSDAVQIGKMFIIKSVHGFPETYLFHPDDFERNQKELARYCQLRHLRNWIPTPTDVEQAFLDVLKEL